MNRAIIRLLPAERDLIDIFVYLRRKSPQSAARLLQAADRTFGQLAGHPSLGARYESGQADISDLRVSPVTRFRSYLVFYRATDDRIEILRVLHGSRDVDRSSPTPSARPTPRPDRGRAAPEGPTMAPTIRLASEDDAPAIRAIYAPFCAATSHVSFEVEPPTVEEVRRRIGKTLPHHPWLVAEEGGAILGYAYAGPHRERAAYRWSVDVSVYVAEGARRSGVGRGLYASLFALLRLQGYVNAFAGATLPNEASVGLHRAMGFAPVGTYRHVGYKAGAWRDVAWWALALVDPPDDPAEPLGLAEAQRLDGWPAALAAGLPPDSRAVDRGSTADRI